jgi:hypothetical protein
LQHIPQVQTPGDLEYRDVRFHAMSFSLGDQDERLYQVQNGRSCVAKVYFHLRMEYFSRNPESEIMDGQSTLMWRKSGRINGSFS